MTPYFAVPNSYQQDLLHWLMYTEIFHELLDVWTAIGPVARDPRQPPTIAGMIAITEATPGHVFSPECCSKVRSQILSVYICLSPIALKPKRSVAVAQIVSVINNGPRLITFTNSETIPPLSSGCTYTILTARFAWVSFHGAAKNTIIIHLI